MRQDAKKEKRKRREDTLEAASYGMVWTTRMALELGAGLELYRCRWLRSLAQDSNGTARQLPPLMKLRIVA